MTALRVWMNGEPVGLWSIGRTGRHRFVYEPVWRESPHSRPLSLSLPVTETGRIEGEQVGNYFDNLLPDNAAIRRRLHTRFATRSADTFDLLQAIGRDCVGAVQLLPEDSVPEEPFRIRGAPLTEAEVEQVLLNVAAPGLGPHQGDDFRISIAGAQEKTALLRIGDGWQRPLGATPTTHILKLPLGLVGGTRRIDLTTSVENEWLCLRVLEQLGLPVAKAEIGRFGSQKALVVERFDRQAVADEGKRWIARLPQEDFCQARGVPSSRKYEVDGGPGMQDCLAVLAGSATSAQDILTFLCAQFAFWLLAATDGHAKNFSLFLHRGGRYNLTPLYDVLSAWPVIGTAANRIAWQKARLAMAMRSRNAHYKLSEIRARHWRQLAESSGVPGAWETLLALSERVDAALDGVADAIGPHVPQSLAAAIFEGVRRQNDVFRTG